MQNKAKLVKLNMIFGLLYQVIYAISGLIVPKLILLTFGSEVNGLTVSLTRLIDCFSLFEGGTSAVIMSSLYKPLKENDHEKINEIFNGANKFYKRIAIFFSLYSVILGLIYPFAVKTSFGWYYVFALVIIISSTTIISYASYNSFRVLLFADQHGYIIEALKSLTAAINIVFVLIAIKFFGDIHVVKICGLLAYIIQPIIVNTIVAKRYSLKIENKTNYKIKQRWDGFAHNLANYVHYSTDNIILTLFTSLYIVSIYGVYEMIVVSLASIVLSLSNLLSPSLGNSIVDKDGEESLGSFDVYEFAINTIVVILFSCGIVLIAPFIRLYTINITDVNYNLKTFGIVFMISESLNCLKQPYIDAAFVKGRFKETRIHAYIEALINVVLSIVLVLKYDLIGVKIATMISILIRIVIQNIYLSKGILKRNILVAFKRVLISVLLIVANYVVCSRFVNAMADTYFVWIFDGMKVFVVSVITTISISYLIYKKEFISTVNFLKGKTR